MLTHEGHGRTRHRSCLGRPETVLNHDRGVHPPQKVEQVIGIASHERASQ